MIIYVKNSIFESNAQVLVNAVNTVGIMGKGIAKDFKKLYPDMFMSYQKYCESGDFSIGKLQLYKTKNHWILNFPTKKDWRNPSNIEYIELGLKKFVDNHQRLGITSVSFPMLGCGNGGLEWATVKPLMEKYLKPLPIKVYIHEFQDSNKSPEHTNKKEIEDWLKNEPVFLSTQEFINQLKEKTGSLVRYSFKFNDEIITVEWDCNEFGVAVILIGRNYLLTIDENTISNIWLSLRTGSIVSAKQLPFSLAQEASLVFTFLSQLEYIALASYADSNGKEDNGIRLLPHKQPASKEKPQTVVING